MEHNLLLLCQECAQWESVSLQDLPRWLTLWASGAKITVCPHVPSTTYAIPDRPNAPRL
jgi:hypothetical protein